MLELDEIINILRQQKKSDANRLATNNDYEIFIEFFKEYKRNLEELQKRNILPQNITPKFRLTDFMTSDEIQNLRSIFTQKYTGATNDINQNFVKFLQKFNRVMIPIFRMPISSSADILTLPQELTPKLPVLQNPALKQPTKVQKKSVIEKWKQYQQYIARKKLAIKSKKAVQLPLASSLEKRMEKYRIRFLNNPNGETIRYVKKSPLPLIKIVTLDDLLKADANNSKASGDHRKLKR